MILNPQHAIMAVEAVRRAKEKALLESQKFLSNPRTKQVLEGISNTLNAYPPSTDILPGPIDNLAFMGLAGINKGIKSLNKVDDVERGVVGAVKTVDELVPKVIKGTDDIVSSVPRQLEKNVANSVKAVEKVRQLPPNELTVYRGGRDMGDSRVLIPAKQNSGALFFTPSEKYAKQYSATPDQVSGVYKTNIKTDKIFDITNPSHIKQLEKYIQPEALKLMKESTNHGAVDWATASQFIDEIQTAGFKGAKFLERPGENITHLPDGSFKIEGKPVYSYALFDKQVPIQRAYPKPPVEGGVSKITSYNEIPKWVKSQSSLLPTTNNNVYKLPNGNEIYMESSVKNGVADIVNIATKNQRMGDGKKFLADWMTKNNVKEINTTSLSESGKALLDSLGFNKGIIPQDFNKQEFFKLMEDKNIRKEWNDITNKSANITQWKKEFSNKYPSVVDVRK